MTSDDPNDHNELPEEPSAIPGFQRSAFRADEVKPRRIAFHFPGDIARHWLGGSPTRTHLLNSLNLFLPSFERSFVRHVKDKALPHLADEHLRQQAMGMAAQEALHSKAHGMFLHNLRVQGFRIDAYLAIAEWFFERFMATRMHPKLVLSSVAAFEHYTDLLVGLLAETDFLQGCDPRMRELMLWHAAEEAEHHAVPFQLLQAIDNGYALRQVGNVLGLAVIYTFMMVGAFMLLWQDRALLRLRTWYELGQFLVGRYGMLRSTLRLFCSYLRRDYRPELIDRSAFARKVLESAPT